MGERKTRSNKGKSRGPYKVRKQRTLVGSVTKTATKCVKALMNGALQFTKTGNPFLKTASGNRYSCKAELKRKGLNAKKSSSSKKVYNQKPSIAPSKLKKGNVRNGYFVKVIKKPASSGHMKVWRKL